MKLLNLILVCLLSTAFSNVFAQVSHLDRFSASEINSKVYLDWIITAGSTCQGIRILRSTDSINFIQIGDIGGVCGNISTPQAYDFTDDNPVKNKINYYRLELGGIGLSKIVSVEIIDLQSGGYQVRPNPITSDARIYFANSDKRPCHLNIFTLRGEEVFHAQASNNYFNIIKSVLQTGTYVFAISTREGSRLVSGRFLVVD